MSASITSRSSRPAPTLSGGEAQRIRLASQVGSGLCGVLYVLDEPTIGLHPRDNLRLSAPCKNFATSATRCSSSNTIKKSSPPPMASSISAPAPADFGGQIVAAGTPAEVAKSKGSVTGPYLSGKKNIAIPKNRRTSPPLQPTADETDKPKSKRKPKTADSIPHSPFPTPHSQPPTSPPSPSPAPRQQPPQPHRPLPARRPHRRHRRQRQRQKFARRRHPVQLSSPKRCTAPATRPGASRRNPRHRAHQQSHPRRSAAARQHAHQQPGHLHRRVRAHPPAVLAAPRIKTPRLHRRAVSASTLPAAAAKPAKATAKSASKCTSSPTFGSQCETCRGRRYNPETLDVLSHGQSHRRRPRICRAAKPSELFENIPKIRRILQTLCDVGLDYLRLGQPAHTLSGGEAQRVKLAAELARPDTGRTLYLLDEPTTGLHFDDIRKLLDVLHRLVDLGNTVIVIEHNLDVIKTADWIIDLGPEAGEAGGQVIAEGTPEQMVAKHAANNPKSKRSTKSSSAPLASLPAHPFTRSSSHTALALAPVLAAGPYEIRHTYDPNAALAKRSGDLEINDVGATAKMPWEANGRKWHTVDRVGRNGEPCRWDGNILERLVDRIQELGDFSDTNWNDRSVVEIAAAKKADGWFLHAITGEQWLLKLKFRMAKATFNRDQLIAKLAMKPLNELEELPVYGTDRRVKVKTLRGPWQEVEMRVHSLDEIDHDDFWRFVEQSVAGFKKMTERVQQDPESVMPWTVMGRKWHLLRKGFPPGKKIAWEPEVLEELLEMLQAAAPTAQFLWNNNQTVSAIAKGQRDPWARIATKKLNAVELALCGPKGHFTLGRVADLGSEPEFDTRPPQHRRH